MDVAKEVLKSGDDIHLIGRVINASKDVGHAAEEFIGKLDRDEIYPFRMVTDFNMLYCIFYFVKILCCQKITSSNLAIGLIEKFNIFFSFVN